VHILPKIGQEGEREILELGLPIRYDDICIPQPHFVGACKHKNVER
jgi:hypothetical protein